MILALPFCKLYKGVKLPYSGSRPTLDLTEAATVDNLALCRAQAKVKMPKRINSFALFVRQNQNRIIKEYNCYKMSNAVIKLGGP